MAERASRYVWHYLANVDFREPEVYEVRLLEYSLLVVTASSPCMLSPSPLVLLVALCFLLVALCSRLVAFRSLVAILAFLCLLRRRIPSMPLSRLCIPSLF